jgi:hypothetical protein
MSLLHTRVQGVMPLVGLSRTLATNAARYHERQSILGRAGMTLEGQSWVRPRPTMTYGSV